MTEPLHGVVLNLPDADYHSHPALSCSGAKLLTAPSTPAHFRHVQDHKRPEKAAFDLGHAAHKEVLGKGADLVIVDAADWRTKAAQQARDEAYEAGKTPMLAKQYTEVKAMAAAVKAHPGARSLLQPAGGEAEASLFYTDKRTGIELRARFDILRPVVNGGLIIADYKTADSANPDTFGKVASNFHYHMQDAWYTDAAYALDLAETVKFVFVVQETKDPYLISLVELDSRAKLIGRYLNRQAIDTYIECTRHGNWPGYPHEVILTQLPAYIENNYLDVM